MLRVLLLVTSLLVFTPVYGQTTNTETHDPWDRWAMDNPSWVQTYEPFRIIDNIYFVGTEGLSSFLITSPQGHILLDGGLPQNAPLIMANIRSLGFNLSDIRILLNSHAHFDHSGGLQALKAASGAKLLASEGDRSALEGGFYLGYEDNISLSAPPVIVDKVIKDGEVITLGGNVLTARITPGHTRGCTSFTMTATHENQSYEVLFFCGATVAGNTLVPEQYTGIIDDYRRTFRMTAAWKPDILLVNHPFFFDMKAKREKQIAGDTHAFINKQEFSDFIAYWQAAFEERLSEALSAAPVHQ